RQLHDLAEALRLEVVATNDVHFLYPPDFFLHRVFTAVREQSHIDAKLPLSAEESWLKTEQEMAELFRDIPDAIANTNKIAEQCNVDLELGKFTFPPFPVPQGKTTFTFLEELTSTGLQRRYGTPPALVLERTKQELEVIRRLGFSEYFLVVWDLLQYARRQ